MKALLIEVQGVLNGYRGWKSPVELRWTIDRKRLLDIKRIVDKTGAEIYLFQSWREHWYEDENLCTEQGCFLNAQFEAVGLKISGKLKRHANAIIKYEMEYFFFEHPDLESYVILDYYEMRCGCIGYPRIHIGKKGLKKTHIQKVIALLNTPTLIKIPDIPKDRYKIVLHDHLLPMNESAWAVEEKYAGRFVYKKVESEMGKQDIIRIDRIEVDEEYKDIALKAELYAAKKFAGDESVYYTSYMDEYNRLMSYAFVCDRWSMYYSYKREGFEQQGVEWLSYKTLNTGFFYPDM